MEQKPITVEKRKRRKASKSAPKRRKTKKDMWAEYGLERPSKPRYSGLRGIVWHLLSLYVRTVRDKDKPCIGCGKEHEDYHGGHFIATGRCGWDGLALNPDNVHKEGASCNFRDKQKLEYERNLDLRYGSGTAQKLRDIYYEYKHSGNQYKNWSQNEYREKIAYYKSQLDNV